MSARRAKPLASCLLPHTLPLCLNSAARGLNPTPAMWCLFPTKAMPHPLPANNQQSLYKGTTHVMSNTILFAAESHYFSGLIFPVFFLCLFSNHLARFRAPDTP